MELMEIIKNRRSVRRFDDRPVPKEVLQDILDCAHLAPTAGNAQPWLIGCITDKDQLQHVADATLYGKFIKKSAACFAVFSNANHVQAVEDGCAATMNIIYGAASNGLGTCWIWGNGAPYAEAVRDILHVPDGYKLIALIPTGYPAEAPHPAKKPLETVSFWDSYN
jgi:nitroreductase